MEATYGGNCEIVSCQSKVRSKLICTVGCPMERMGVLSVMVRQLLQVVVQSTDQSQMATRTTCTASV